MNAADDPSSILDRIYDLYRGHIPARHKELFLALLDSAPSSTPGAEWIQILLNVLDTLLDPWRPVSKKDRKARAAIRGACNEQLMKLRHVRWRQQSGDLPL